MSSVTTVPFMEAVEQVGSARAPDWYVLECELCWPEWVTFGGRLWVCEEQALEHLVQHHPRRYRRETAARREGRR